MRKKALKLLCCQIIDGIFLRSVKATVENLRGSFFHTALRIFNSCSDYKTMMFICQRTGFIRQQTGFIRQRTGFICQWTGLIHVHNELASKASPLVYLVSSLTDEASPLTNVPVNCVLSILKQLWAKSPKFRSTRYLKIPTLLWNELTKHG